MSKLADMDGFVEQVFGLGDADDEAGLALAREVALEEPGELTLPERNHLVTLLVLEVLVDVAGPAGGGAGLPHDQDPLLSGLWVDPLEPDAGGRLYPLHCLHDDGHLCL